MTNERGTAAHWNERYSSEEFLFGTEPNQFLIDCVAQVSPGSALSLGEGEGRNAVWLARQGFTVTSFDQSSVAVAKTHRLAASHGVEVDARVATLAGFDWERSSFDFVMMLFVHPPAIERAAVHRRVTAALRPGGHYVLESFSPEQIRRGVPGPKDPDHAPTAVQLQSELEGLEFIRLVECDRPLDPNGPSDQIVSVVQLFAYKPS